MGDRHPYSDQLHVRLGLPTATVTTTTSRHVAVNEI